MKGEAVGTLLLALLGFSDARIWSLAIGHDWGGHEYFDDEGRLKGFGFDLVDKVCSEGNMDCRMVYDRYPNCWRSNPGDHSSAGRGLMARWYDGCMAWVPTVERIHTLSISAPYLVAKTSTFWVLKGGTFDTTNLANKKIGLFDGWSSNEKCLARQTGIQNNVLTADQIKLFDWPQDAVDSLEKREVEAIFVAETAWTPELRSRLDRLGDPIRCELAGNGIISRKDSSFTQYWNVAFAKLKDSNQYSKYCDEWNEKHRHKGEVACKI